jgi:hypothetical protein
VNWRDGGRPGRPAAAESVNYAAQHIGFELDLDAARLLGHQVAKARLILPQGPEKAPALR